MPKRLRWSESTAERTLVLAAAVLALAFSAFAGWRLLGTRETDTNSELVAFSNALSIADGHHKYGIVATADSPTGPSYALIPWVKLGIRDPGVLRRVPFAFGLLCEGLLLAAIAAMRASTARRLWLIVAMGIIFMQPGIVGWLGALHEQSYLLSFSFALLAAAAALRDRFFRPAVFALTFLSGWMGYDFCVAQFFGVLAIRWLVHCREDSDGELAGPLWNTGVDGVVAGLGTFAAVFTHLLQNAGYYGGFAVAFKSFAGAAATRMTLQAGAKLNPEYYQWFSGAAAGHGNPPRLDILREHLTAFVSAGWIYPVQFALLCGGMLLSATTASRRAAPSSSNAARLGVFSACVLFCASGWIMLMPGHAAHHVHFLPRHYFVAAAVLALASVMLPDALSEERPADRARSADSTLPALRGLVIPALRISGTLGFFFAVLNMASLWPVAKGSTLRWRIFVLFGVVLSAWALLTRLKWRPKIADPKGRLEAALLAASAGFSAYGLYCIGAELFSGPFSGFPVVLTVVTAAVVVWKHRLERKSLGLGPSLPRSAKALVALALLLASGIIWLETARLMYWGAFADWISSDGALFAKAALLCALVPVLLLWGRPRSQDAQRKGLLFLDALAVLILFIFSFEKDLLLIGGGDFNYPVFIAPVDYIRSGGHLLWDVPSQYGFLNIHLVAALKMFKPADAFYLVNSTVIFLGTLISYFAFRLAWPTLGAPLVGIPFVLASSIFLPGVAPATFTPGLFPSDGPFRYMICYSLVLLLLLQQVPGWKERLPTRRVMRMGSFLWLIGCFWSAESSAYCSAIWFPALLLLDGQSRGEDRAESPWKAFTRSAGLLKIPGLLLGGALALLCLDYLLKIGHIPDFRRYFDYALSYKNGFTANPNTPSIGDHWLLLFFFSNFLILAHSVKPAKKPLAATALFCCWAVSSYYSAISYPHSILNIFPICMLALHITIYVLRTSPVRGEWDLFAQSVVRAMAFAVIPFMLLNYYQDPAAVGRRALASVKSLGTPFSTPLQLRWNGDPEPATVFNSASDRAMRAALLALLQKEFKPEDARCVISLQNYWENDPERQELWAPFLSTSLVWPLSLDVRIIYWDRFMARVNAVPPAGKCAERWVAYNDQLLDPERYVADNDHFWQDSRWELGYLQRTMRIERRIDSGGWHLVKLSSPVPAVSSLR